MWSLVSSSKRNREDLFIKQTTLPWVSPKFKVLQEASHIRRPSWGAPSKSQTCINRFSMRTLMSHKVIWSRTSPSLRKRTSSETSQITDLSQRDSPWHQATSREVSLRTPEKLGAHPPSFQKQRFGLLPTLNMNVRGKLSNYIPYGFSQHNHMSLLNLTWVPPSIFQPKNFDP